MSTFATKAPTPKSYTNSQSTVNQHWLRSALVAVADRCTNTNLLQATGALVGLSDALEAVEGIEAVPVTALPSLAETASGGRWRSIIIRTIQKDEQMSRATCARQDDSTDAT